MMFKRGPVKPLVVRSGRRSAWLPTKAGFLRFLHLACLAGLLAAIFWFRPQLAGLARGFVGGNESLRVDRLLLQGNALVTREEIIARLGVGAGDSMLDLDLQGMTARLAALPAVRTVQIKKEYPSALQVRIEERIPVMIATLSGGEAWLADEEGILLMRAAPDLAAYPRITGVSAFEGRLVDVDAGHLVTELRDAAAASGLPWPGLFSLLDMTRPEGPVARLTGNIELRLGHDHYREKLLRLTAVLPKLEMGTLFISSIDLRFDQRVVVGTTTPPAPAKEGTVKEVG